LARDERCAHAGHYRRGGWNGQQLWQLGERAGDGCRRFSEIVCLEIQTEDIFRDGIGDDETQRLGSDEIEIGVDWMPPERGVAEVLAELVSQYPLTPTAKLAQLGVVNERGHGFSIGSSRLHFPDLLSRRQRSVQREASK